MIKKDCKDIKLEEYKNLPHKAFCDRWFIDLAKDGSTCHECEHNPEYVEKVLLPNRIKVLEKQYKPEIRPNGIIASPPPRPDRREPCDYEGEESTVARVCCGGRIENVKEIYCHFFKQKKEKSFCLVCPNYVIEK